MELMVACQGIDMRGNKGLGKGTQAAYDLVRKAVATLGGADRELYDDINYCEKLFRWNLRSVRWRLLWAGRMMEKEPNGRPEKPERKLNK